MKISLYSYGWNLIKNNFDYKDAISNWALYADEIVISVNTSDDGTYEAIETYAKERNFPVNLILTAFDSASDPFFYGKVVDSALQGCSGDFLIAQDFDERLAGDPEVVRLLGEQILNSPNYKAFFVPTIDLYGNKDSFVKIGQKWYFHRAGLKRGPVNFGIKDNGRPDYNKTSTDELTTFDGKLVPTFQLLHRLDIESLRAYAEKGLPFSFHVGYLNLTDRVERAKWWSRFWKEATGGDPNGHITDINVLLARETKTHGLPLWKSK